MFAIKIKTFVIIIGQEIANITPYITKNIAPIELIILSVLTFFIKKEMISATDAK